jgi:hypothetical protein
MGIETLPCTLPKVLLFHFFEACLRRLSFCLRQTRHGEEHVDRKITLEKIEEDEDAISKRS